MRKLSKTVKVLWGPGSVLSRLEHCPIYQKVEGSILGQGTYRKQSIFLSHIMFLSFSLSLKSINISSGEDFFKYFGEYKYG